MKTAIDWNRLFRTPTYWIEKIQNDLFGQVMNYLEKTGKTKQEFAKDLGVSKGYISQILNGEFDHKLSKLVQLYLSIGKVPLILSADLDAYANSIAKGASQDEFITENCIKEKPSRNQIVYVVVTQDSNKSSTSPGVAQVTTPFRWQSPSTSKQKQVYA